MTFNPKSLHLENGIVTERKNNFNYAQKEVLSTEIIEIPLAQQMLVIDHIWIEGELHVEGELIMEEFNHDLEFTDENFSYHRVESGSLVAVPVNQQMLVIGDMEIEGQLTVEGELIIDQIQDTEIPPSIEEDNYSWKQVPSTLEKSIPENQQMLVDGTLLVEGQLNVEGELSIISDEIDEPHETYFIREGQVYTISNYKQMFLAVPLILEGEINVEGILALGA